MVDWANFYREVNFDHMLLKKNKIGGEFVEVEIDESKFGKRKYHRGIETSMRTSCGRLVDIWRH